MNKVYIEDNKLHLIIDDFTKFPDGEYSFVICKDCNSIVSTFTRSKTELDDLYTLDMKITDVLKDIGIPSHLNGYDYLRILIEECYKKPQKVSRYYPLITSEYDVKRTNIEKSIRSAIDIGFSRCNLKAVHRIFGYTTPPEKGSVCINQFVSQIVIFIRENRAIDKMG